MSRSLLSVVCVVLVVAGAMIAVAACFCPDECDVVLPLAGGQYRLEATSPNDPLTRQSDAGEAGVRGGLVYDRDAGTVIVTRLDGGSSRTERWRVVRLSTEPSREFAAIDGGFR